MKGGDIMTKSKSMPMKDMPKNDMPKSGHMPMHKEMHKGTGKKGK